MATTGVRCRHPWRQSRRRTYGASNLPPAFRGCPALQKQSQSE